MTLRVDAINLPPKAPIGAVSVTGLAASDLIVVIGPNGAGKSVLTRPLESPGSAGDTGFEVKSTSGASIELDTNYRAIRGQFRRFRLIAVRTDIRPYHLWVIELPQDPPHRVQLERRMDARTPNDDALEVELARQLSAVVTTAGTSWTDARDRDEGCNALRAAATALQDATAGSAAAAR